MKKILLALLGVLIALPTLARDFKYTYEGQTLTYTVVDEAAKTCMTKEGYEYDPGNEVSGELVIPEIAIDEHGDSYSVIEIGNDGFLFSKMTNVTIPNSVTSIGDYAFYGCSGLTQVKIPDSVTYIGDKAFDGCEGLKKSAYPNTLKNPFSYGKAIAYNPDGALIEDYWIYGPDKSEIRFAPYTLEGECTIPETVTSIGDYAFYECNGLKQVKVLSDLPPQMFSSAFDGLYENVNLEVPAGAVHNYMLTVWANFKNIYREGSDEILATYNDGVLNYKLISAADGYERNIAVVMPGNYSGDITVPERFAYTNPQGETERYYVEALGYEAFYNSSINNVSFNSRIELKNIGVYAFYGCSKLSAIEIPSTVESIGYSAFQNCSGLTSVTLNDGLNLIDDYAFQKCIKLSAIEIPSTVESIGYGSFYDCSGLEKVTLNKGLNLIGSKAFYGCTKLSAIDIPSTVGPIGESAFDGCRGLTSVSLNDGLDMISAYAFRNCTKLSAIEIPSTVGSIGESAFDGCSGLTSVSLNDGLNIIGAYAFRNCSKFSSIEIPSTVESLGEDAFNGCSALNTIIIGDSIKPINIGKNNWTKYITKLYMGRPIVFKEY